MLPNSQQWDGVCEDAGLFFSRTYLETQEGVLLDNISPRYALITIGASVVAAVVMQLVDIQLAQVRPEKSAALSKKFLAATQEKLASRVEPRVLVCGRFAAAVILWCAARRGEQPISRDQRIQG